MPKVGRARWTPNPNSKVVKRQLNFFSHNQPASLQAARLGGGIGGGGGVAAAVAGLGGAQLTLGDVAANGNVAIKSNTPSESTVSDVTTIN